MASSAADPPAAQVQPYVVEDCPGLLQLLSDGTVVRFGPPPFPTVDDVDDGRVEWKDAVYDTDRGLGVRMYKPAAGGGGPEEHTKSKKLPVLVHFHGGGFCVGSYAWPSFHAGCARLAAELPAVVLSFDYRLAPENRVPAAYEDAAAALLWLRGQLASNVNPWLADAADARKVFVSGEATGANLAHHLALRSGTADDIAGLILVTPAFLSEQPTRSELDTPATAFLTRELCDALCRLFLPAGADKDHPLINPLGPESPGLDPLLDVAVLVVAAEGDLLRDKNVEYAERLRALAAAAGKGKDEDHVELVVFAGEEHGFFGLKPTSEAAGELVRLIARFVATSVSRSSGSQVISS